MSKKLHTPMNRRHFISQLTLALGGLSAIRANPAQKKRILLRSAWQTLNIGDIAHTPGLLTLLEKYLPEVEVYLWPSRVDSGVDQLLMRRFPKLKIVQTQSEINDAFRICDFLIHGSSATLSAQNHVIQWHESTGKPFGVYGISFSRKNSWKAVPESPESLAKTISILSKAAFVYFRDSKSLALAKDLGCTSPVIEFGPDAAFACDLKDEEAAERFLHKNMLKEGRFLCCIPRYRYTPFWSVFGREPDPLRLARNMEMKEQDHAPHREAITQVVENLDMKVLICPEDRTQMQLGKEMIYDKLPAKIQKKVVWKPDYWLTGEAISTYIRSAGLFGNEMHSPIMCIGHGIPAIVCRWDEQTTKGYMWEDIGLKDWLFDMDDEEQWAQLPQTVLDMASNPKKSRQRAVEALEFVKRRQTETMQQLSKDLQSSN